MNYIEYVNFTLRQDAQKYQDVPSRELVRNITQELRPQTTQAPSSIAKEVKKTLRDDAAKRVYVGGNML